MPPKRAIPRPRHRTADSYRRVALEKLKKMVEEDGREFNPTSRIEVTPLLKATEGGIQRILEALRAHEEPDAQKFITLYDSLSAKDRVYLKLEEIAHAAGITALRLAEVSQSAVILHCQMTTNLRIWSAGDAIVKRNIQMAKTGKGLADREWALKHLNYIPLPKGIQINNNTQINNDPKQIEGGKAVYLDPGERLRQIHEAVEQRRLPAQVAETLEIPIPTEADSDILNAEYE